MKRLIGILLCITLAAALLIPAAMAKTNVTVIEQYVETNEEGGSISTVITKPGGSNSGMMLWGYSDPKLVNSVVTYTQGDMIRYTGLTVKSMEDYYCGLVPQGKLPTEYTTTSVKEMHIDKDAFLYGGSMTAGEVVLNNRYATFYFDTSNVEPGLYRFMGIITTKVMSVYSYAFIFQDIEIVSAADAESGASADPVAAVVPAASEAPAPVSAPTGNLTASPTRSSVYIDGQPAAVNAYKIGWSNYFKLRDLAYLLSLTDAKFNIQYSHESGSIAITTGQPYTAEGGEMIGTAGAAKMAAPATVSVTIDGGRLSLEAYEIDGYNYFKLRDLGQAAGFQVSWNPETDDIHISTK